MNEPSRRRAALAFARVAVLCALAAAVLGAMEPPAPRGTDAPSDAFSAARAMEDVRWIAAAPHPPGTDAHRAVRERLVARLTELGWNARVVRRKGVWRGRESVVALDTANVVATPRAPAPEGVVPLILAAHYDSHGTGPGAGDDASGVASLLEIVRALGDDPPPGLRVLVTDGEEQGLLGARAAVEGGEVAAPGIVLNVEARGGGGPVFMFETGDGNAALVEAFAAAPQPRASSLMVSLYKLLPNDTDLTVFKDAGLTGLNFAFAGAWTRYHTALDTPENLDPRSVQQEGDALLALVRRLADPAERARLSRTDGPDAVYFDLCGRVLARYPAAWVWPLFGVALLGWAACAAGARREAGFGRALATGALLGLAGTVVAGATGYLFGWAIGPWRDGVPWRDPYGARWFEASLALLCAALVLAAWMPALRKRPARALALGGLLWWLGVVALTCRFLPGASYLFLWPLLAALAALATPKPAPALALLAAAVWAVLFVPVWHGLSLLLGFGMPAVLGAVAGLGAIPLLVAFRGDERPGWWGPKALLVPALLCAAVGTRVGGPRVLAQLFFEDADTGTVLRASVLPPDPRSRRFPPAARAVPARDVLPFRDGVVFVDPSGAAPGMGATPTLTRRGNRLEIAAPGAAELLVWSDAAVGEVRWEGAAVGTVDGRLALRLLAPTDGAASLVLDAPKGTVLHVQSVVWGSESAVSGGAVPAPVGNATGTVHVRRSLVW